MIQFTLSAGTRRLMQAGVAGGDIAVPTTIPWPDTVPPATWWAKGCLNRGLDEVAIKLTNNAAQPNKMTEAVARLDMTLAVDRALVRPLIYHIGLCRTLLIEGHGSKQNLPDAEQLALESWDGERI